MIKIIKEDHNRQVIPKKWGCEIILHNDDKYCGKLLQFERGSRFSMHFHMMKTETWYVNYGVFNLRYIDTSTADMHTEILEAGTIIEIEPGTPHQLIAVTKGEIFEVSTPHYDSDSYRVEKGDSQL